jgi:glycerol-3-phosphate dehydrogenase
MPPAPGVGDVLALARQGNAPANARLVQGSHIIVRRLNEHDRCYIFQNADDRIIFAMPYENDFTLLDTTDRVGRAASKTELGDDFGAGLTESEVLYLMREEWEASDILWRRSKLGLRLSQWQTDALERFTMERREDTGGRLAALQQCP